MQIVTATHYFESHRGGVEIVAGELARALETLGLSVAWLASDATPPPRPAAGVIRAVPLRASNLTERRLGFPLPLPGPSALATIWREVRKCDAVLLHDSLYPTNVAARLSARLAGKPAVIVQHVGAVPYRNPALRHLMRLANALIARPMLASADQAVFISETTRRHFCSVRFKRPPRTIFNGVDTNVFRPLDGATSKRDIRATLGLPPDAAVALFVGRFVEKKGLDVLERMARLAPQITFALAGWGPLAPDRWGLANVRVIGGLSGASLARLYQAADALVLPSTGEGLPLVIQEALACGLPVLCGMESRDADPELADLVEGVAVDPADAASTARAFSTALDGILARPESVERVEDRFSYVSRRYNWASAAAAYREIIEGLVSARRNGEARPPVTVRQE